MTSLKYKFIIAYVCAGVCMFASAYNYVNHPHTANTFAVIGLIQAIAGSIWLVLYLKKLHQGF